MVDFLKDQRAYVNLFLKGISNEWREQRNCKEMSPSDFFDGFEKGNHITRLKVLSVCRACPVREDCLEYGKQTHSSGVWGGEYLISGRRVSDPFAIGKNGKRKKAETIESKAS